MANGAEGSTVERKEETPAFSQRKKEEREESGLHSTAEDDVSISHPPRLPPDHEMEKKEEKDFLILSDFFSNPRQRCSLGIAKVASYIAPLSPLCVVIARANNSVPLCLPPSRPFPQKEATRDGGRHVCYT